MKYIGNPSMPNYIAIKVGSWLFIGHTMPLMVNPILAVALHFASLILCHFFTFFSNYNILTKSKLIFKILTVKLSDPHSRWSNIPKLTQSLKPSVRNHQYLPSMALRVGYSWCHTIHARELKINPHIQESQKMIIHDIRKESIFQSRTINIFQVGLWGQAVLGIVLLMLKT